jgi:SAM-dependent methyltransferase
MRRVGHPRGQRRLRHLYEARGRAMREEILGLLPAGWSFEGKKVLDFGCGAGRVLVHFLDEAASCELWGCDVDAPSIEWLEGHFSPPLRVFRNEQMPPLPVAGGTFDLVWALSVFTHLVDSWSEWLLEIHRVLADDGLFIATFIGEGASARTVDEPWQEDRVGMNPVRCGQDWALGGPVALHSPWWIRAHWGRAFEVVSMRPAGFGHATSSGQGVVVLRKRPVSLAPADLERWDPDEPRELEALRHNVEQLQRELAVLRRSWSWRVTAPLRAVHESLAVWPGRIRRLVSRGARRPPGYRPPPAGR